MNSLQIGPSVKDYLHTVSHMRVQHVSENPNLLTHILIGLFPEPLIFPLVAAI